MLQTDSDSRLVQLWGSRDQLSEVEWTELYNLVFAILKRSNPNILRSLPESKEQYIQEFFLIKVFEPAKHNSSSPRGRNELCTYFNNFLIDVYRGASLRTTDSVEDYDEIERTCENVRDEADVADSEFFDYGISREDVHLRAKHFLEKLDETGRCYLALNTCADESEPLYKMARRLNIQSQHSRAQKLGITRKKGEFGNGYEATQIGDWLTNKLGLELADKSALLAALKILCIESLYHYQDNGSLR